MLKLGRSLELLQENNLCLLIFCFLKSERSGSIIHMRQPNMFIFSFHFRIASLLHNPNSRILEAMSYECNIILLLIVVIIWPESIHKTQNC